MNLRLSRVARQDRVTEEDDVTAMGSIDVTGRILRRESVDPAGATGDLRFSPNLSGGSRKQATSRYGSTSVSSSFQGLDSAAASIDFDKTVDTDISMTHR